MEKNLARVLFASFLGLLAGCASATTPIVLDAVGPDAGSPAHLAPMGSLVVFSYFDRDEHEPVEDYLTHYTNYEIWTPDGGKRLQFVVNHPYPLATDEPARIQLTPGRYLIKAHGQDNRRVDVPVVIAANRFTTVHLDGGLGADKTRAAAEKVYLPDGGIVGSRARPPASTTASAGNTLLP